MHLWNTLPFRPLYPTPESLRHLAPKLSAAGVDLLESMLVYDPEARIDCRRALKHPYFSELAPGAEVGASSQRGDGREPMAGGGAAQSGGVDLNQGAAGAEPGDAK